MLQVFINGPPGSGKTSLCRALCEELTLEPVATGDLLRDNIAQRTPLGQVARACIASRTLVPDHVVVDMVVHKIRSSASTLTRRGWVLDGFPRTADQAEALRRQGISPTVVLVLELSEPECVVRVTGRRFDPVTSRIYHMPQVLPRDPGVLARLTRRGDDAADKLPPRMEAYRQYGELTNGRFQGVVHRVPAGRRPDELLEAVLSLLHAISNSTGTSGGGGGGGGGVPSVMAVTDNQPHGGAVSVVEAAKQQRSMPQRIDEEEEEEVAEEEEEEGREEHMTGGGAGGIVSSVTENEEADDEELVAQLTEHARQLGPFDYDNDDDVVHTQPQQQQQQHEEEERGANTTTRRKAHPQKQHQQHDASKQPEPTDVATRGSSRPASNNDQEQEPGFSPPPPPPSTPPPPSAEAEALAKFKDMLLDGFEVLKHGRRGNPHARVIFTDMELKRIFWMKPTKEAKAKKAKLDQSLLLADVIQVVRGMKTEVLKRSGDVARYERYLSLVADDRTLDMELPSDALCGFLCHGFEQLLHGGDT